MGTIQNSINSAISSVGQVAGISKVVEAANQQKLEREDQFYVARDKLQGEINQATSNVKKAEENVASQTKKIENLESSYKELEKEQMNAEFRAQAGEAFTDEEVEAYNSYDKRLYDLGQKINKAETTLKGYQREKEKQIKNWNERKEYFQTRAENMNERIISSNVKVPLVTGYTLGGKE